MGGQILTDTGAYYVWHTGSILANAQFLYYTGRTRATAHPSAAIVKRDTLRGPSRQTYDLPS